MLSQYARSVLNDPALIQRRDMWFDRLSALVDGRPDPYLDEHVMTLCGVSGVPRGWYTETYTLSPDDLIGDLTDLKAALPLYDEAAALSRVKRYARVLGSVERVTRLGEGGTLHVSPRAYLDAEDFVEETLERLALTADRDYGRFAPLTVDFDPYGVHFIDKLLGANVYFKAGQWNVDYLKTPVGQLECPDLEKCPTWALARRAAQAFVAADVALPIFGMPTLSSPLHIFINLYGQDALIAMLEDEDAARHDLAVISDLIRYLHGWYRAHVPLRQLQPIVPTGRTQPPGYGQICGCSTQLLSGSLYRDFIMPLDDQILGDWPHGGLIHLCGSHAQHIPTFRDMPHLKSVQLNDRAAADLRAYYEGLRPDQIIYLNPCPEMPLDEAIRITGGHRLVICDAIEAPRKPSA